MPICGYCHINLAAEKPANDNYQRSIKFAEILKYSRERFMGVFYSWFVDRYNFFLVWILYGKVINFFQIRSTVVEKISEMGRQKFWFNNHFIKYCKFHWGSKNYCGLSRCFVFFKSFSSLRFVNIYDIFSS